MWWKPTLLFVVAAPNIAGYHNRFQSKIDAKQKEKVYMHRSSLCSLSGDHALPGWTRSDIPYLDAHIFFNKLNVIARVGWKLFVGFGTCRRLLPTRHGFVRHFDTSKGIQIGRKGFERLAVQRVSRGYLNIFKIVQYIYEPEALAAPIYSLVQADTYQAL